MQDRHYFLLKRLHSLSGVVPVAGFVIFHLFENSNSVAGQEAFNHTTHTIRSLPYLYLLEIGLLAPIVFHALAGAYLAFSSKPNVGQFGTRANWSYLLQRVTGGILLFFIAAHVWSTRFAGVASDQMFQYLATEFAKPAVSIFYILGILSAAFHLSNGIWGFLLTWGLVTGAKSMDLAWKLCIGLGVAVALMGLNALAGFHGKGIDLFQHAKTQAPAIAAPSTPAGN